jgi:hypothetical protein
MVDNKNISFNPKFTVKGLSVLLVFSFVATVIGFSVAYTENKNYRALTKKYDQAIEKVSDLEMSVAALMSTTVYYPSTTDTVYPAEDPTEAITTTISETREDIVYPNDNTNSQNTTEASEQISTTTAASGTYYVTQSGKKYHIASCSYLSKSKIAITIDRINAEGYSPCSRCIK